MTGEGRDRAQHGGRPRLLFLGQSLPYPPDSGVAIRTYHVLKTLAERFDIDALFFWRARSVDDGPTVEERVAALSELAATEAFAIPGEASPLRFGADHLLSLGLGQPYTRFVYASRPFAGAVRARLREHHYDLVHVDSLDLVGYLPDLPLERTVLTHHNVESALMARRAERESRPLVRRVMRRQSRLLERAERKWCRRVALNVAVSRADADALERLAPGAAVTVVPNGVDTRYFAPRAGSGDGLVFVGGTSWFPNRDALAYFAEQILPALRRRFPRLPVRWVGRAGEAEREAYAKMGVEMTGYVPDVRPPLADAACVVVPLRVGGGTRLKILDAWSMGKAVVSTSIGCEGLAARHGDNILIADPPEAFASEVSRVLTDDALRDRLETAARGTAVERYCWDAVGGRMSEAYDAVSRRASTGGTPA